MSTENPKVSAYVPSSLKIRLTQFREERNISESQAVTIILAEYFGLQQEINRTSDAVVGGVTLARIEKLEQQMADLLVLVQKLSESNSLGNLPSKPLFVTEDLENLEHGLEVSIPTNDDLVLSNDVLEKSELLNGLDGSSLNNSPFELVEFEPRQLTIYGQVSNTDSTILEIPAIPGRKLSEFRFGMSKDGLAQQKMKLSLDKLVAWTKTRDPDGIGWKPASNPKEGYVVADELSSELKGKLLNWMRENGVLS